MIESKYRDDMDGRGVYWDGTPEEESEYLASLPSILEQNKAQLWQAAHDYEFQRISGAALSLLALGVAQGKPKCSAVAMWLKGLWDDNYYPRKALINSEQIAQLQLDFSVVGEMPYTVQEMSAEVYGG